MKQEVKKWFEEHKVEIAVVGGIGLITIGGVAGWKMSKNYLSNKYLLVSPNNELGTFIRNTSNRYFREKTSITDICLADDRKLRVSELGRLYEIFKDDVTLDHEITNVLLVGPSMED